MKKYADKQDRINRAIQRVKKHLEYLANKYHGKKWDFDTITGKEKKEVDQWNDWHDLESRLKHRLKDNWSNYQDWHWDQYGWCAY